MRLLTLLPMLLLLQVNQDGNAACKKCKTSHAIGLHKSAATAAVAAAVATPVAAAAAYKEIKGQN